jgi:hypothetical protein
MKQETIFDDMLLHNNFNDLTERLTQEIGNHLTVTIISETFEEKMKSKAIFVSAWSRAVDKTNEFRKNHKQ